MKSNVRKKKTARTLTSKTMRKSVILLAAIAAVFSSCSRNPKNDLEEFCLQGKVKKVSEYQYQAKEKFGKIEKGESFREDGWDWVQTFSHNGNLVQTVSYGAKGEMVNRTVYEYSGKDSTRKIGYSDYDSQDSLYEHTEIVYNKNGEEIQNIHRNENDEVVGSFSIEFAKNKKTTFYYSGGGKVENRIVQIMDGRFPVETQVFDQHNELRNTYKETFNRLGLRDSTMYYDVDGAGLIGSLGYEYDKYGNLTEIHGQDAEGQYLPEKNVYEYDEKGNWIVKIHYTGDQATTYTEREIEYY